jgi:hypothetical protein
MEALASDVGEFCEPLEDLVRREWEMDAVLETDALCLSSVALCVLDND